MCARVWRRCLNTSKPSALEEFDIPKEATANVEMIAICQAL